MRDCFFFFFVALESGSLTLCALSCITKTGHDLSRKLRDLLLEAKPRADGGLASNDRENTFMPRQHERDTGCPHALVLTPGVIHTQASPDFFCNPVS